MNAGRSGHAQDMGSAGEGPIGDQTGQNTCPTCTGTGTKDNATCPTCAGSGVVVEPVGDA